ncbi:DivIVA domain-containing protein [Streptococcus loxodontisalivarius]|uniref:Cell division initiation protein n=1 Tax=Streptococcus loxodontisalivarius TaxID=1349415 RepID=A0ABS2PRK4_9STRE|nr:DivIVA domain-containing protein [Streptococcus loxodontisalivarius]MBM7642620.1 cell division initiation protein [Streptococcus loxodontisalivarius]
MAITALEIKDKTFGSKFRGYNIEEVDEFLDIVVADYEALTRANKEQEARIKTLEEKIAYFDEMKESLSQSVILAQETAEKVKTSATDESTNILNKANYDAAHLIEEAKAKANEILRDATDEAKRVAVETEDLKRQSRVFHQRLLAAIEGQLGLANSPEWNELLQPTAVYLQNSDAAFREVVEKVLDEHVPESTDETSFDATRQFTPEEMAELQRRVEESNKQLEEVHQQEQSSEVVADDFTADSTSLTQEETQAVEVNLNETQTFKLNIEE